ncbi:MAG: hypothetical protein II888_06765 [Clostridia bacterium]|nr:hypothetical protein [Clostridia bacterium]
MKKCCALVLACMLLLSWAGAEGELRGYEKESGYVYLTLGEYPQTADGGILPILWRVLTVDETRAYLLSEYILLARTMHTSLKEYRGFKGDFAQTELCHYLNTEFAGQAFTAEETEMLLPCENYGKVFLISLADMKNKEYGLGSTNPGTLDLKKIEANPGVRAWGTEWAIRNNGYPEEEYPDPRARVIGRAGSHISQEEMRLYVFQHKYGACSPWWSRTSSSSDARHAICTKDGGQIGHIEVGRDNEGVRPAVYLAMDSFEIQSGSGTKDDPYVITGRTKE